MNVAPVKQIKIEPKANKKPFIQALDTSYIKTFRTHFCVIRKNSNYFNGSAPAYIRLEFGPQPENISKTSSVVTGLQRSLSLKCLYHIFRYSDAYLSDLWAAWIGQGNFVHQALFQAFWCPGWTSLLSQRDTRETIFAICKNIDLWRIYLTFQVKHHFTFHHHPTNIHTYSLFCLWKCNPVYV